MGIKIDFGPNADNVVTIQTPPRVDTGCDIASMLPEWENDVDIVGSVFQLGAIQVESPELGHEFQVLSHKKFMKLRKRASREEAKIIAKNAKNKQKNKKGEAKISKLVLSKDTPFFFKQTDSWFQSF